MLNIWQIWQRLSYRGVFVRKIRIVLYIFYQIVYNVSNDNYLCLFKEKNMKYVLVTGAYGGMGRAAALALRDAGYSVLALDLNVSDAEEGITPIRVDVTSEESVKNAYIEARKITNKLYAIVHFAGIYMLDSLVEVDEGKYIRAFDVNLFGVFRINKAFLPMLSHGSRVVITTSELAPLRPLPFTGIYAITKSALDRYAYSLRMELQLLGISVTVLRPGAVRTDMLGVSTAALDRFCENTQLYACNAKRFKGIVESVEAKNVSPEKVARRVTQILAAKHPRYVYSINRNSLLLLLNALPPRLATWIIKQVLK